MWRRLDFPLPAMLWEAPGEAAAPTVLFLHGAGERGRDGAAALRHGLPNVVVRPRGETLRVLVPQCPPGASWVDHLEGLARGLDALGLGALAVTGFSMGGQGTWAFAARFPDRVSRLGPVAARLPGDMSFLELADRLPDVPIWAAHGARDARVPVAESDAIVTALTARGRRPVYKRYATLDHAGACEAAYGDDAFRAWLTGASSV